MNTCINCINCDVWDHYCSVRDCLLDRHYMMSENKCPNHKNQRYADEYDE